MTLDRTGLVTFNGAPLTLSGNPVKVGDKAPDFYLLGEGLLIRTMSDYEGKVLLLNVVPSLDTGICDLQTRRFNAEAAAKGPNVEILTISCDLPFAQSRWCGAAGVDRLQILSDYRDLAFGMAYGLVLKELRLLTRAVLVVDAHRVVTYMQIAPEIKTEVDYEAALEALAEAVKSR